MLRLEGKGVVVTASSRGIGRAVALRAAREGADVAINYHQGAEEARQVLAEVEAAGRRGVAIQADLRRADDARQLIDDSARALGRLDVLVNNAGGGNEGSYLDVDEDQYDDVLNLTLKGAFFASQAFARRLIDDRRPGRIVNISSVHEDIAFPGHAAYCAAKGGVRALTRDLAIELAPHNITVNAVAPGLIATDATAAIVEDPPKLAKVLEQIPLRRLGTPDEVAAVVAFLASDDAAYVTGSAYFVDGGLTWFYEE